MKYTYTTKNIDISKLEKELELKVSADKSDEVVNGYINTRQDGDDVIVEVFTYEEDEPANYVEGLYGNIPYNKGHKTSFEKPKDIGKIPSGIEKLTGKVSDII